MNAALTLLLLLSSSGQTYDEALDVGQSSYIGADAGLSFSADASLSQTAEVQSDTTYELGGLLDLEVTSTVDAASLCDAVGLLELLDTAVIEGASVADMDASADLEQAADAVAASSVEIELSQAFESSSLTDAGAGLELVGSLGFASHPGVVEGSTIDYQFSNSVETLSGDVASSILTANGIHTLQTQTGFASGAYLVANGNTGLSTTTSVSGSSVNELSTTFSVATFSDVVPRAGIDWPVSFALEQSPTVSVSPGFIAQGRTNFGATSLTSTSSQADAVASLPVSGHAGFTSGSLGTLVGAFGVSSAAGASFSNTLRMEELSVFPAQPGYLTVSQGDLVARSLYESVSSTDISSQLDAVAEHALATTAGTGIDVYWLFYRIPFSSALDRCETNASVAAQAVLTEVTQTQLVSAASSPHVCGVTENATPLLQASLSGVTFGAQTSRTQFVSAPSVSYYDGSTSAVDDFLGTLSQDTTVTVVVRGEDYSVEVLRTIWRIE